MHFKLAALFGIAFLTCANNAAVIRGGVEVRRVGQVASPTSTSILGVDVATMTYEPEQDMKGGGLKIMASKAPKAPEDPPTSATVISTWTCIFPTTTSTFTTTYTTLITGDGAAYSSNAVNTVAISASALYCMVYGLI